MVCYNRILTEQGVNPWPHVLNHTQPVYLLREVAQLLVQGTPTYIAIHNIEYQTCVKRSKSMLGVCVTYYFRTRIKRNGHLRLNL